MFLFNLHIKILFQQEWDYVFFLLYKVFEIQHDLPLQHIFSSSAGCMWLVATILDNVFWIVKEVGLLQ